MTAEEASRPGPNRGAASWIVPVAIVTAVLGIVLATYWPALSAQAQYMDDKFYLGPLAQHPSWRSVKTFFREVLAPSMVNGYYQPLALVSVMLDFLDPAAAHSLLPFHRTALLLHLLNVGLVALLLHALARNWFAAGLLALLYGLHPLNADVVLWVAERKTVLSTFFALSSLVFYLAYARHAEQTGRGDWKRYGASLFMYAGALLSKPTALPVVAALFVFDYWPLQSRWRSRALGTRLLPRHLLGPSALALAGGAGTREAERSERRGGRVAGASGMETLPGFPDQPLGRRRLLEKVPFLLLAALSGVVTVLSQAHSGHGGTLEYVRPYYWPLTVAYGLGFYLLKLVWPVRLVSDYPYPQPFGLTNTLVLGTAIVAVGAGLAVVLSLRRTRAWLAGGSFFVLTILPTLGLIRFTMSITTNRSMYLPMVGLLLPLHWELAGLWSRVTGRAKGAALRAIVICVGTALAAGSAYATRRYQSHWQDSVALLRYYLSQEPSDGRLHTRLGNEWIQRGDHTAAIVEFKEAVRLDRNWTENHLNLGRALFTVGEYAEAARAFAAALGQTPNDWRAHMLMGMAEGRLGNPEGALREFREAARLAPKAAMAHFHIATVLGQQGKLDEAVEEYRQTLRLEPRFVEARRALDALTAGRPDGEKR